jgi:endonuclease/exonuclease/phosphatase family metal-dependent hydrolase
MEATVLISPYNPPGEIIESDLDLLIGTGHKVILAGDFSTKNVTWHARQDIAAGQSLLTHYYKNYYIIFAEPQTTHFPVRNRAEAKIQDFAILSNVLSSHSVRTLGSLSTSDHSPLLLTISGPLEPNFFYREANWELFHNTYLLTELSPS